MKKRIVFCVIPLLFFSHSAFAQIEPVIGLDVSALLGYSSNYGWELAAFYPFVGLEAGPVRLSAFAGGGLSAKLQDNDLYYEDGSRYKIKQWYWTYSAGGNLDFFMGGWVLGDGGGIAGPNLSDESKALYPFVRASIG